MPYTYLIGWSSQMKYYYGVRYAKDCCVEDLWKSYFTSSKYVKKFRKQFGEPDIIVVRRAFITNKAACNWEHKVLRRLKVTESENFLNKTDNNAIINSCDHYKHLSNIFKGRSCHPNSLIAAKEQYNKFPERRIQSKERFQKYGNQGVYEITHPCGKIEKIVHLKSFCETYNISYSAMSSLSTGKYKCLTYKGYKSKKLGSTVMIRTH